MSSSRLVTTSQRMGPRLRLGLNTGETALGAGMTSGFAAIEGDSIPISDFSSRNSDGSRGILIIMSLWFVLKLLFWMKPSVSPSTMVAAFWPVPDMPLTKRDSFGDM